MPYYDHVEDQDFIDLDKGQEYDSSLGMRRSVRKALHPEIFRHAYTADLLGNEKPPVHVQAACEELLGKEPDVLVRLHPLFKRWCVWERAHFREHGHAYTIVSLLHETPESEEALPSDFLGVPHLKHLHGLIGEYRLPTRVDFVEIASTVDRRRFTTDQIEENLNAYDLAEERAVECEREARIHDFTSYSWQAAQLDANQQSGACQKPWSLDTIRLKEGDRYIIQERNGFRVRAKAGTRAGDELEAEIAEEKRRQQALQEVTVSRLEAAARQRERWQQAKRALLGTTVIKEM